MEDVILSRNFDIFLNGQQIQHEYVRTELTVCCISFY